MKVSNHLTGFWRNYRQSWIDWMFGYLGLIWQAFPAGYAAVGWFMVGPDTAIGLGIFVFGTVLWSFVVFIVPLADAIEP